MFVNMFLFFLDLRWANDISEYLMAVQYLSLYFHFSWEKIW